MNTPKLYRLWKIFTLIISTFLFLHFLKDITQDLLHIDTVLDVMGDIQEETTRLPKFVTPVYWTLWIIATLAQPIIGYLTLRNWNSKDFNKDDLVIFVLAFFFFVMMIWAYSLSI